MSSSEVTFTLPQPFPIAREICRAQASDPKWDVKSLEANRVVLTERSSFFAEAYPVELHITFMAKADAAEVQIYASNSGSGPIQSSHVRSVVDEFKRKIQTAARERPIVVGAPFSVAKELRSLTDLFDQGGLSRDEFERAREIYLGRPLDKVQQMLRNLQDLYHLYQQGVLGKIEFEIKKRDLLAAS
jgi:hypothetical protein